MSSMSADPNPVLHESGRFGASSLGLQISPSAKNPCCIRLQDAASHRIRLGFVSTYPAPDCTSLRPAERHPGAVFSAA
jgi:hypothetical protein